jgi:hypothetical protein
MNDLMKKAKMKAIMDIMSQMEDMELERLMPKSEEMPDMEEMEPEKKGITIVKLQSSKKPEMELKEEEEDESENEEEEDSIDPYSALGRIKARMKMKGM